MQKVDSDAWIKTNKWNVWNNECRWNAHEQVIVVTSSKKKKWHETLQNAPSMNVNRFTGIGIGVDSIVLLADESPLFYLHSWMLIPHLLASVLIYNLCLMQRNEKKILVKHQRNSVQCLLNRAILWIFNDSSLTTRRLSKKKKKFKEQK